VLLKEKSKFYYPSFFVVVLWSGSHHRKIIAVYRSVNHKGQITAELTDLFRQSTSATELANMLLQRFHYLPTSLSASVLKVKVTLQLTVSWSTCFGVEPTLELVTRYFLLPESCCLVSVERPLRREVGSVSCQSLSAVLSPLSKFNFIYIYMSHMFCVCTIYTRPLSAQAQYKRSCPFICILRYNSSLNTWTVVRLTAAKFKPLILVFLPYYAVIGRYVMNKVLLSCLCCTSKFSDACAV
jgi:hypothetical protein